MRAFVATLKIAAKTIACVSVMGLAANGVYAQQVERRFPPISLVSSMTGQEAITALGENLPLLATWYDMTPEELRREFCAGARCLRAIS
jgi:hypothetical protein